MKQHKSINLTNKTHYLSKDLKRFFATILKRYRKTDYDLKFETFNIECTYSRKGVVTSEAWLGQNRMVLKMPKEIALFNKSSKLRNINSDFGIFDDVSGKESFEEAVAMNFMWCLDIARGINKQMQRDVSFVNTDDKLKIGSKAPVIKLKKNDSIKLTTLQKRAKVWESKMKRCENALAKLNKQIKYYQKKVTA